MPEFSQKQLEAFSFGLMDDEAMESAMIQAVEDSSAGEVAKRLRQIETLARQILDPSDSVFLNLMMDVPAVDAVNDETVNDYSLIVVPRPDVQSQGNRSLVERTLQLPSQVWRFVLERPRKFTFAVTCAALFAIGGFRLGDRLHDDEVADKIAAVEGRRLRVAGERANISVFVVCDQTRPLSIRLDAADKSPTPWREFSREASSEVSGNASGRLEGVRVDWPQGRPGCVVQIDPSIAGILYLHQKSRDVSAGGWANIVLPLSRNPELFQSGSSVRPESLNAPFSAEEATTAREAWASYLNVDKLVTNSIGLQLVLIPPGEFTMGSHPLAVGSQEDETEHRVQLTKPFYAGVFEVSQGEFRAALGYDPSHFHTVQEGGNADGLPVENLTWYEMIEFCNRLSEREKLPAFYEIDVKEKVDGRSKSAVVHLLGGEGYRLPTEAEWEYLCRAGTVTRFYSGDSDDGLLVNTAHVRGPESERRTIPVGSFAPNAFGLHDTHGNVFEMVYDWYDEAFYRKSPRQNPVGSTNGYSRVIRGGSFKDPPSNARSANRGKVRPETTDIDRGFRIVRSAQTTE